MHKMICDNVISMKRAAIFVILISAGLLIYFGFLKDFFTIDACLDRGGCWDSTDRICRIEETNAQEVCDR